MGTAPPAGQNTTAVRERGEKRGGVAPSWGVAPSVGRGHQKPHPAGTRGRVVTPLGAVRGRMVSCIFQALASSRPDDHSLADSFSFLIHSTTIY